MDLGTRRRLRREQLRRDHGTEPIPRQDTAVAWLVVVLIVAGSMIGGFAHMPIATALDRIYCTPESCATLPQVLTGWAIAVAPPAVYFWHRHAAFYLGLAMGGFMTTLFITSNQDIPVEINPITGLWALSLTYFLTALLFVPVCVGVWRLVR